MRESSLRKYHRITGVTVSLFIVLQVLTGMLMSIEMLANSLAFSGVVHFLHYGDGIAGNGYRIVLALTLFFMIGTGWWIFMKIATRAAGAKQKHSTPTPAAGSGGSPAPEKHHTRQTQKAGG